MAWRLKAPMYFPPASLKMPFSTSTTRPSTTETSLQVCRKSTTGTGTEACLGRLVHCLKLECTACDPNQPQSSTLNVSWCTQLGFHSKTQLQCCCWWVCLETHVFAVQQLLRNIINSVHFLPKAAWDGLLLLLLWQSRIGKKLIPSGLV